MVQTNGYLVECGGRAFLVDAPAGIADWLRGKGVEISDLFLTHQHYDHVEDAAELQAAGARIVAFAGYSKDLTLETYGAGRGLPEVGKFEVDRVIGEGEAELFGKKVKVGHVPGHSADSLTFFIEDEELVFSGDALFEGSVGRCDLPGGSLDTLISGIRRELMTLPDQTRVLPGHGGETTIGRERVENGYIM